MTDKKVEIKIEKDHILSLETGKFAPQASAAVIGRLGETVVLATITLGRLDETKDYFPLSVEYSDKLYAGGTIKSSRWLKREGGLIDESILRGRIIDRSIRPLFPDGFMQEVQVIVTVLSNDKVNDPIIPAFNAVSLALSLSNIPFNGPVSATRIALLDKKLIKNPTEDQVKDSQLDLLVCSNNYGVNMIEAGANIVDNDTVISAIDLANNTNQDINKKMQKFVDDNGQTKIDFTPSTPDKDLLSQVEKLVEKDVAEFVKNGADDGAHMATEQVIVDKALEHFKDQIDKEEVKLSLVIESVHKIIKKQLRARTLKGLRFDGRKVDQIRPVAGQVSVLPRTHGSAFFQRGLTQALTITTISTLADQQNLQDSTGESTKRYIHYYNALPFSTGQTGRVGRPGRREVGHGALAEKALAPVIPSETEFPYTIILNSEVLSQNGSSSMASTCGSTLSLMDAGVPIKSMVAGISIGMVSDDKDNYQLLTDIAGIEDHNGDMDFKITGTKDGVTAIQLDIKRIGLTMDMIKATFEVSTKARLDILATMAKVLSRPRAELSVYAPKIKMITLPEDKIGEVIGSGGKTIKKLMERYSVQIDIDDLGQASISGSDQKLVDEAAFAIESMVRDIQVGEEFDGVITRIEDYGAFVEFLPGREALVHVSEMAQGFVKDPRGLVKMGDKIHVKVTGFNDNHQIKLSAPELKAKNPGQAPPKSSNSNNRSSFKSFDPSLRGKRPRRPR